MTTILDADPSAFVSYAVGIKTLKTRVDLVGGRLDALAARVDRAWVGDAATSFSSHLDLRRSVVAQLSTCLGSAAGAVESFAQTLASCIERYAAARRTEEAAYVELPSTLVAYLEAAATRKFVAGEAQIAEIWLEGQLAAAEGQLDLGNLFHQGVHAIGDVGDVLSGLANTVEDQLNVWFGEQLATDLPRVLVDPPPDLGAEPGAELTGSSRSDDLTARIPLWRIARLEIGGGSTLEVVHYSGGVSEVTMTSRGSLGVGADGGVAEGSASVNGTTRRVFRFDSWEGAQHFITDATDQRPIGSMIASPLQDAVDPNGRQRDLITEYRPYLREETVSTGARFEGSATAPTIADGEVEWRRSTEFNTGTRSSTAVTEARFDGRGYAGPGTFGTEQTAQLRNTTTASGQQGDVEVQISNRFYGGLEVNNDMIDSVARATAGATGTVPSFSIDHTGGIQDRVTVRIPADASPAVRSQFVEAFQSGDRARLIELSGTHRNAVTVEVQRFQESRQSRDVDLEVLNWERERAGRQSSYYYRSAPGQPPTVIEGRQAGASGSW